MTEPERVLLDRARALGGRTIGELARALGREIGDPLRHKGAIGALIEEALGVPRGLRAGPDFSAIGVELKTLPIDAGGRPAESTFVCCAPRAWETSWQGSSVRRKLARVLFVPVEAGVEWRARRIGTAFLWSPDPELEAILRADWEELGERLASEPERVSARDGRALQLRPKARDGAVRVRALDAEGAPVLVQPRAFYLRRWVTERALACARLWARG